jgi:hypothetical protein
MNNTNNTTSVSACSSPASVRNQVSSLFGLKDISLINDNLKYLRNNNQDNENSVKSSISSSNSAYNLNMSLNDTMSSLYNQSHHGHIGSSGGSSSSTCQNQQNLANLSANSNFDDDDVFSCSLNQSQSGNNTSCSNFSTNNSNSSNSNNNGSNRNTSSDIDALYRLVASNPELVTNPETAEIIGNLIILFLR